jgi:N-acetylneuraminic acid mutarotase
MKKLLLILAIAGATYWFYSWYVYGVNILLDESASAPPPYSFATRLPSGAPPASSSVVAWQRAMPMPTARTGAAAAAVGDEIFVIGGTSGVAATLATVEAFDVKLNFWRKAASLPEPLHHVTAVAVDKTVFVFGGLKGLANEPVEAVYAYDVMRDEWRTVAQLPRPLGSSSAVLVDGLVHLVGGDSRVQTLGDHYVFDPATGKWDDRSELVSGRDRLGLAFADGRLWAVGGRGGSTLYNLNALSVYDFEHDQWDERRQLETARSSMAVGVSGHRIFVAGGEAPTSVIESVDAYDIRTDTWQRLHPMPTPRYGAAYAQIGDKLFIIGGGQRAGFSVSDITEVFNLPADDEALPVAADPEADRGDAPAPGADADSAAGN